MIRQELAVKGSLIGIVSQVVTMIMKLAVRTFVIRFLGVEILGLDGVLIDVVSMLSLAEMGITTAMLYRLYQPVIGKDEWRIRQLMSTYRKVFLMVSAAIAGLGVLLSFFLRWVIRDISIPWPQVYIAFFLQLACTAGTYLFSYYRILLYADQKKHIGMLVDLAATFVFNLLKVFAVVVFRSYPAYLFVSVLQAIGSNVWLAIYVRRKYPFIRERTRTDRQDIKTLTKDAKQVLGGKLAGYVYGSTDNLIISAVLGTVSVGLLSNYKYIATALRGLVNSAMSAIQPIIGNYLNSDTPRADSYRTLHRYTFIRYVLAGATVIPFIVLADLFIRTWTGGSNYLMPASITILLALDYYIGCVYGPLGEYMIGLGMFRYEKYVTLLGAFSNIVLSLIGVLLMGIPGVLAATVISQMFLWIGKGYVIFEKYYQGNREYLVYYVTKNLIYCAGMILVYLVVSAVSGLIGGMGILPKFLIIAVVSELCFGLMVLLLFRKSDEFRYAATLVMTIRRRIKK